MFVLFLLVGCFTYVDTFICTNIEYDITIIKGGTEYRYYWITWESQNHDRKIYQYIYVFGKKELEVKIGTQRVYSVDDGTFIRRFKEDTKKIL